MYNKTIRWDGTSNAINGMGNTDIPRTKFQGQKLTRVTSYQKLIHGELNPKHIWTVAPTFAR
eukprot:12920394-Prorocentrum_lima.AAC.1